MTEDTGTTQHIKRVAQAVRAASNEGNHDVIVIAEDATKAFVHLEVSPGFIIAHARADAARPEALVALGWRGAPYVGWTQYFYPQRGRDYKGIAEWISATLTGGFDSSPHFSTLNHKRAPGPLFAEEPMPETSDLDSRIADSAEQALVTAPFEIRRDGVRLDLISVRKRHRAQLALSVASGTISADVLHLLEPDDSTLVAHLRSNRTLGHSPFVYAERTLAGGQHALVLQSKIKAPRWATLPTPMTGTLCGLIEPLLAAHRRLHTSPR